MRLVLSAPSPARSLLLDRFAPIWQKLTPRQCLRGRTWNCLSYQYIHLCRISYFPFVLQRPWRILPLLCVFRQTSPKHLNIQRNTYILWKAHFYVGVYPAKWKYFSLGKTYSLLKHLYCRIFQNVVTATNQQLTGLGDCFEGCWSRGSNAGEGRWLTEGFLREL